MSNEYINAMNDLKRWARTTSEKDSATVFVLSLSAAALVIMSGFFITL